MKFLLDPKVFNYLILTLYMLNAGRWAYERKIADVCYWVVSGGDYRHGDISLQALNEKDRNRLDKLAAKISSLNSAKGKKRAS